MQSICLLYNIPGLYAVTAVDGFNSGDVDGDAVWNKIYKVTFFSEFKINLMRS